MTDYNFIIFNVAITDNGVKFVYVNDDDTVQLLNSKQSVQDFLNSLTDTDILVGFRVKNDPWVKEVLSTVGQELLLVDLSDDMDSTLSLTAITLHLGLPLKDTNPLKTLEYLFVLRTDYILNKLRLAEMAGLDVRQSLLLTEASLMANVLQAKKVNNPMKGEIETPDCIDWNLIPDEVKDFFESMPNSEKLTHTIGNLDVTFSQGGCHGALAKTDVKPTGKENLWTLDVKSMYPYIMVNYNLISRAVPEIQIFKDIIEKRVNGDYNIKRALKGPLNKVYGAMKAKHSNLYDPLYVLGVCITGQLLMCMLMCRLAKVEGLEFVQVNTDGLIIYFATDKEDEVTSIVTDWQKATNLQLTKKNLNYIYQKDVSNYLALESTGKIILKGGWLNRGIDESGKWTINFNSMVVCDAICKHLMWGMDIDKCIEFNNNVNMYQIITKIDKDKYSLIAYDKDTNQRFLSACRVYAAKDKMLGTLLKKNHKGGFETIANIPKHCLIGNDTIPSIEEIDKTYYIELAKKQAERFKR